MKLIALATLALASCAQPALAQTGTVSNGERVYKIAKETCIVIANTKSSQMEAVMREFSDLFSLSNQEQILLLNFCLMYEQGREVSIQKAW